MDWILSAHGPYGSLLARKGSILNHPRAHIPEPFPFIIPSPTYQMSLLSASLRFFHLIGLLLTLTAGVLALSSGTVPVDANGTVLAFTDSGTPTTNPKNYLTIFAIHGFGFNGGKLFHELGCEKAEFEALVRCFQEHSSLGSGRWGATCCYESPQLRRQHAVLERRGRYSQWRVRRRKNRVSAGAWTGVDYFHRLLCTNIQDTFDYHRWKEGGMQHCRLEPWQRRYSCSDWQHWCGIRWNTVTYGQIYSSSSNPR
jgi:hypothetical protein